MSSDFASLGLAAPLLRALSDEGYTTPTPIQAKTIPALLAGNDVLGCAQTGTGKTAAFALPLLQRLLPQPGATQLKAANPLPRVLVLAPTRELATQIVDSFTSYGRYTLSKTVAIYGGVSQFHQVKALQRGVDILVATPGRLIDLMQQRLVRLDGIQALVLDEADRMLDMGFIEPIRKIVAALPKPRHTLLFSATMPKEIMHLADALLRNPVKVAVSPVATAAEKVEQQLYHVDRPRKQLLLEYLLDETKASRAVVFTKTKHGADRVAKKLVQNGFAADAIHGNKAQNRRQRTLDRFRNGSLRVLVATDVAARGLDVDGVSHVFNFDLPMEPEAYVHRIGRTGRAGASGIAISFCDREEVSLLRQIERLTKVRIPELRAPTTLKPTEPVERALPVASSLDEARSESRRDQARGGRTPKPSRTPERRTSQSAPNGRRHASEQATGRSHERGNSQGAQSASAHRSERAARPEAHERSSERAGHAGARVAHPHAPRGASNALPHGIARRGQRSRSR